MPIPGIRSALAPSGGVGGGIPPGGNDPYWSNVVLLMGFNGADAATTSSDESPAVHGAATFTGNAQLDTAQSKFGGSSLLLDGNGDYLDFSDHADWSFGNGQFTIEAWVRFNDVSAWQTVVSHWNTVGTSEWVFDFPGSANNQLRFAFDTDGGGTVDEGVAGVWTPSTNTWYHVAVDRDASSVMRLYADGSMLSGSKETRSETFANGGGPLRIGALTDPTFPHYLNGWIDEIRITKGVARYASDSGYSVPTAAFPRS